MCRKRSMKGEEAGDFRHRSSRSTSSLSSSEQDGSGTRFERRVFAFFDKDMDGSVSASELRRAVWAVGGELTKEEAEMAVRLSDSDGDGMLGFKDFVKLMEGGKGGGVGVEEEEEELREAFGRYEMEGRGCITPLSLKRMLGRLGESTTIESCEAIIRRFDLNGDGVLCFDEFKIMMA
ncbi:unnamed protein product [Cuscuta campestris]|uniref:EF-hand domain-containing protein n=1 Tax=Cuscuta campestris TaxID=132261 RepID=A0A484KPR8_9ASTE|nr:unnamed protein product [Cuscuta campestris]